MVQRHWWNGNATLRGRRDVYIRTDGQRWDVMVQTGGASGAWKIQECPGERSAIIVASAWRGSSPAWRELVLDPGAGRRTRLNGPGLNPAEYETTALTGQGPATG